MAKANRDGEYLSLITEGPPDALYVRGHITHEAAMESVCREDEDIQYDCKKHLNVVRVFAAASHTYGRWSMEPADDGDKHCLRLCRGPGRGRFKLTELEIIGTQEDKLIPGGSHVAAVMEGEKNSNG